MQMILGISLILFIVVFFLPFAAIKIVEFGWIKQVENAFLIVAVIIAIIIYLYGLWNALV